MEDEKTLRNNNSEVEDTVVTSLETAKELRSILPYCRQISALRRYIHNYMEGNYGCITPGYAIMIDKMAMQFNVFTSVWLMGEVDRENRKRYGKPLPIDEFPECLLIDPGEGRTLEDVCTQIMAEEDYILSLKNKTLYIADHKNELQYGKVGYDPVGDNFWQCVTWQKRGFLLPASAEAIVKCREEGSPELPSYMTTRPPISPYRRSSALQSACIVEKYINQNSTYLQGFEDWIAKRYKKEN